MGKNLIYFHVCGQSNYYSPGAQTCFCCFSVYMFKIILDDVFPALFATFCYLIVLLFTSIFSICMFQNYHFSLKNAIYKITSRVAIS